jgi:uncharacterized protein YfaS (alpha-2-macroglobulin family)
MKLAHLAAVLSLLPLSTARQDPPEPYADLKLRAEAHYAQGSFSLARDLYHRADLSDLPLDERRWVQFRLADTLWRSRASTGTPDPTDLEAARLALEELTRITPPEPRDLVWAEAHESLGDFSWTRRGAWDWSSAWSHYQSALSFWSASPDLELARERYLAIVWKMSAPDPSGGSSEPWRGGYVPETVLENAVRLARAPAERSRAHFLLAMTLRQRGGDARSSRRIARAFEAALEGGKEVDGYDDALYFYAQWLAGSGRVVRREGGGWSSEPDFRAALALYRRLAQEFAPGESRWRDDALRRAEEIVRPVLGISASTAFLPGSEIALQLSWRNLARVKVEIYPVDLTRDLALSGDDSSGRLAEHVVLGRREPFLAFARDTGDAGDHRHGSLELRLERKLPTGAYVVEATAAGQRARDLVLVSDAAVLLKASSGKALAWATDALSGAPLAGAQVQLLERVYLQSGWSWRRRSQRCGEDGLARFELGGSESGRELLAIATLGARTAFAVSSSYARSGARTWRFEAITDRPAYRPEDTVHFKLLARLFDGERYSTPAGETISWSIQGPQGAKVAEGKAELNAFGSAWGELSLAPGMHLGEYQILLASKGEGLGQATLFRLEEYKLPELEVRVETPREAGAQGLLVGDVLEAVIRAETYFGAPVAGASVEVLLHQSAYHVSWTREREHPWLHASSAQRGGRHWGGGSIVAREVLRTDAEGRASFRFETPLDAGSDLEYRVEARVRDSSRREVVSTALVRVGRQGHYAFLEPLHALQRPGEAIEVELRTQDVNGGGVAAEGSVELTRERWVEVWLDPAGTSCSGEEMRARLGERALDPPHPWRLVRRGYERELVRRTSVATAADGRGSVRFTADVAGAYRIAWASRDQAGSPVAAEAAVWVASDGTSDLGWRRGPLEILVDSVSVAAGEEALVLLSSTASGGWALFAVEGEELLSAQVVHLAGTVKLLRVRLDERHVPNTYLSAHMVRGGEVWTDVEELVVAPVQQFLSIEVRPDRATAKPGETMALLVAARDHSGEPVQAEVALALVDDSVLAIQREYARDPREVFWGHRRALRVATGTSFELRRYVALALDEDGRLVDRGQARLGSKERHDDEEASGRRERFKDELDYKRANDMPGAPSAVAEMAPDGMSLGKASGATAEIAVRSDFRATAFWQPDVLTGPDGTARVELVLPQTLTRWKATARAATRGSQFGQGEASLRTVLPLSARLQAPRFFVAGDRAVLSALVDNRTAEALRVHVELEVEGLEPASPLACTLSVEAGGQARAEWTVDAVVAGEARLRVRARAGELGDAMERRLSVHEHGIERLIARSGKLPSGGGSVEIRLPGERRAGSTRVSVAVTPSLAVSMLDALPYLVEYPYGCTEQTMSRFLPAAIVARTLRELGLDAETAMGRAFGGIEPEFASRTHPRGETNLAKLGDVAQRSLARLYDFQHADGGWGWWKEGESDPFMSAYVLWGLSLAHEAGVESPLEVARRAAAWLDLQLVEAQESPDLAAWILHALAAYRAAGGEERASQAQERAMDALWERKERLNAYTRALFALAAHGFGQEARAQVLVDNLVNGVTIDRTPDASLVQSGAQGTAPSVQPTAHWGSDGVWWRWSDSPVEATATALRALLAIRPRHELVQPVVTWLVRNRRGAQWSSTRDTAIAVLALEGYLRASGELVAEVEYEVLFNGTAVGRARGGGASALSAPARFDIAEDLVRAGANRLEIRPVAGEAPLYFALEARFFSLEEPVTPSGNELFVRRQYYEIVPRPTLLEGYVHERRPLEPGRALASGARIEAVLTIEAKNELEYLLFEDLKPAGLEAVLLTSGEPLYALELRSSAVALRFGDGDGDLEPAGAEETTGRSLRVHQELLDRKVALFVDRLPQGIWQIRYELRAEVPGAFHALPVMGEAMYVPEIRANGAEERLSVAP